MENVPPLIAEELYVSVGIEPILTDVADKGAVDARLFHRMQVGNDTLFRDIS